MDSLEPTVESKDKKSFDNPPISVDKIRAALERVGLDPIRVNYFLSDGDIFDVIRISPKAYMGYITVLSHQYREMAEFTVMAHAFLLQKYREGSLGTEPRPQPKEYWWVEFKEDYRGWDKRTKKIGKVMNANYISIENVAISSDKLRYIKKIEEPDG